MEKRKEIKPPFSDSEIRLARAINPDSARLEGLGEALLIECADGQVRAFIPSLPPREATDIEIPYYGD